MRIVDMRIATPEWDYARVPKGGVDGTALLGPGVYVLWRAGKVVHIAWAKGMLQRVAQHKELVNQRVPSWFPIRPINYSQCAFWPCAEDRAGQVLEQVRREVLGESAAAA